MASRTNAIITIHITAGNAKALARMLDRLSLQAADLAHATAQHLKETLQDNEDDALDLVEISYSVPGEGTTVLDY